MKEKKKKKKNAIRSHDEIERASHLCSGLLQILSRSICVLRAISTRRCEPQNPIPSLFCGGRQVLRDENNIYMIFPYCGGGELFNVVTTSSGGRLSEARAKSIFRDVLAGMSFMHGRGVCHRWVEKAKGGGAGRGARGYYRKLKRQGED